MSIYQGHGPRYLNMSFESDDDSDESEVQDHDYQSHSSRQKKYINKGRWTKSEDDSLKRHVEIHGSDDWKLICSFFPDRSEVQCQHRWHKVLNPELIKGPWTKEEDEKVVELVRKYGARRWTFISKHLKGRTGKQCRERWHNHLNPDIKKTAWTEEEDRLIYDLHKKLGNRWAEIAKYLPGRTDNAIKNHWNSTMRRKYEPDDEARQRDIPQPFSYPVPQVTHNGYHDTQASTVFPGQQQYGNPLVQRDGSGSLVVHNPHNMQQENMMPESAYQNGGIETSGWSGPSSAPAPAPYPQEQHPPGSPRRWMVTDEGLLSPIRCFPGISENIENILSDMGETAGDLTTYECMGAGDLTTYELLCGTKQDNINITPPGKFTGLNSKGKTEYRFDGQTISSLKDTSGSSGGLISLSSAAVSSKLSTPPILRRSKRKRRSSGRDSESQGEGDLSHTHTSNASELSIPEAGPASPPSFNIKEEPITPHKSPIKGLPFSPSQFLNSPGVPFGGGKLTSTPVCRDPQMSTPVHNSMLNTPHIKTETGSNVMKTPRIRRSILDCTPRTPTPFKNALAEFEKKIGALRTMPQTPNRWVEDLKEVIEEDTGVIPFSTYKKSNKQDVRDSGYSSFKRTLGKENKPSPSQRVRKALDKKWSTPGEIQIGDSLLMPETPSKSLIGDQSIVFSPPSILKETLHGDRNFSLNDAFTFPVSPKSNPRSESKAIKQIRFGETPIKPTHKYDSGWKTVVCGKTQDQLDMTEQARMWLTSSNMGNMKPRSLKL